jgi:homoserine O-succinyltransferase
MPIKIPDMLPAFETLESENIFVMSENRANTQDIRPLKIAILNLMPTKIVTETQLLRLLSNTPLQVEITFLVTKSYTPTHTSQEHLESFYRNFDDVKNDYFDGLIVTGAPVENKDFEDVQYWEEICKIFEWADKKIYSCFYICWASMAALYYYYGIQKYELPEKLSGVFRHKVKMPSHPLVRGFDQYFNAPHSRHYSVHTKDIEQCDDIDILASSEKTGVYIAASHDMRKIFVTGHSEYDYDTLKKEYLRDLEKGMNPHIPENYFPYDDPEREPVNVWKSHAHLLYSNWLNYFVYQRTPFDLKSIENDAEEKKHD